MKTRPHFQFQQFSVADDQCSMKVGTDAVLLAAWFDVQGARHILDIGTGSGVMALVAAQRTGPGCFIDGVEIQAADCAQAAANIACSPWAERMQVVCSAVQEHCPPYQYDVIICNPPYFINSLRSPEAGRTTARHATQLDHMAITDAVDRLLSESGSANFVMPPDEGSRLRKTMESRGMRAARICRFRTRPGKKVERVLMSFMRSASAEVIEDRCSQVLVQEEEVLLYETGDQWSAKYSELTRELYLPRPGSFPKSV